MKAYDIFISYRRKEGADTAKHLRDVLTSKGYRVFFDTDSLRSGDFNTELLRVIEECKDFIVILTPGALDRCVNENDWVRQEIACALKHNKNIVPVISSDFTFPETLPEEIDELRFKNGVTASVEYFDALVDKLLTFLSGSPKRTLLRRRILPAVIGVIVAAAAVFGIWQGAGALLGNRAFPSNQKQKTLLEESVNFWMYNAGLVNSTYVGYNLALDDILAYCNNEAGAKTAEELQQELKTYTDKAKIDLNGVAQMKESLANRLADVNAVKSADLSACTDAAKTLISTAAEQMGNLSARLKREQSDTDNTALYVKTLREITKLDAEAWMVSLNQVFAGVKEDAVTSLLSERLPLLTQIYDTQYRWTQNENELKTREDAIYEKMQQANQNLAALIGNLTQENESIAAQLEESVLELVTPQEADSFVQLWARMQHAYGYDMPDRALDCINAMQEKADGSVQALLADAANGWYYLARDKGYRGCCIVMGYSDPAQPDALQTEDFIVEVDGRPVNSSASLSAVLTDDADAEHTFTVLRADENTELQLVTVTAKGNNNTLSTIALEYAKISG